MGNARSHLGVGSRRGPATLCRTAGQDRPGGRRGYPVAASRMAATREPAGPETGRASANHRSSFRCRGAGRPAPRGDVTEARGEMVTRRVDFGVDVVSDVVTPGDRVTAHPRGRSITVNGSFGEAASSCELVISRRPSASASAVGNAKTPRDRVQRRSSHGSMFRRRSATPPAKDHSG